MPYPLSIHQMQIEAHQTAKEKGFWDEKRNNGELIALIHSELSEALEGLRKGDTPNVAEEMADAVIRIGDFCEANHINLEVAIKKKMKTNKERPYKHNKQF